MRVRKSRLGRAVLGVLVVIALLFCAAAWYVNDYYHADEGALAVLAENGTGSSSLPSGELVFESEGASAGFVFYPGAKVEPASYAPLMRQIADEGLTCVIVQPPFNLAILDSQAAGRAMEAFPEITTWIVGGHSMGGVAAASFCAKHPADCDALVLLASYPNDDLTGYEGKVLSVIGSEDAVLNRERYAQARGLLPGSFTELVIAGGNHAGFGNYGLQSGDGDALITAQEQQRQTADALSALARSL